MAGNSQRRGATRKPGSKKGAVVGSGGQGRKALQGKGPTPKAEDRPYHPAAKRKAAKARDDERPTSSRSGAPRATGASSPRRGTGGGPPRRTRSERELVSGRNAVVEALRAQIPATTAYLAHRLETDGRIREILGLVRTRGIPLLEVTKAELDRLTDGAVHQGVAIQIHPYEYAHPDDLLTAASDVHEPPLIVALDSITDPRNLGAVIRSAAAFGAHGVLIPSRRSAGVSAATWKVSAGAAARLPVAQASNLTQALEGYREQGLFVVGLAADGDTAIDAMPSAIDPMVLVVGSEGKGLSRLVQRSCDFVAAIPIDSATESLNAGVATGIALYEISKQRVAARRVTRH